MAELWKELHTRALNFKGEEDRSFLLNFAIRIPRYTTGCKCREFWNQWVKTNPPVFGNNGEYFAWSTRAHNAVSKKLGKPTYTVEEARKFYEKK